MRCQACEKNEANGVIICDSCRAHYASIREGRYEERDLAVGASNLKVRSWIALVAPAAKKEQRDEKAKAKAPKKGFFGRPAQPPVEEVPPPPPPDWKSRIGPLNAAPDAPVETTVEAPAAEMEVPVLELAPSPEPQPALSVDAPPANEVDGEPEPNVIHLDVGVLQAEPAVQEESLDLTDFFASLEAPASGEPIAIVTETPAQEGESDGMLADFLSVLQPSEPPVESPEGASAPEPVEASDTPEALTSFLESLAQPYTPAEEEPAPSAGEPSTPEVLSSFLESLSQPAAPSAPENAHESAPEAPPSLAAFFETLSPPSPPAPSAPAEPVAATAERQEDPGVLASFLESFSSPAPAEPEPAPEPPALVIEPAPVEATSAVEPPAPQTAGQPFAIEIELPAASSAAPPAVEPALSPAKPEAPKGEPFAIDLSAFLAPASKADPKPVDPREELKRQHAQGGFSIVVGEDDDDDEPKPYELPSHPSHHDDDDTKVIEL